MNADLICFGTQSFYVLDVLSDTLSAKEIPLSGIVNVLPLKVDGYVAMSTPFNTYVYELKPESPQLVLTLQKVSQHLVQCLEAVFEAFVQNFFALRNCMDFLFLKISSLRLFVFTEMNKIGEV